MLKNPHINALLAALYIALISFALQSFQSLSHKPDTILAPIIMLSLFTLSAAVMVLLFIYTPAKMFLENKKEALTFFLKTLGTFACLVAVWVAILFLV